jgi:HlyD family secretion protein
MKLIRRAILLVVLAACLTAGGLVAYHFLTPAPVQKKMTPPSRQEVAALGRIWPGGGILEVGLASGRVTRLLVTEGQTVKKGEVLAYLDNYEDLLAAARYAQSQFEGGQTQLKYRTVFEKANIEKAKAELDSIEQLAPAEIKVQEQTVEKNRLELELAQAEVARLERLVAKSAAPREDLEKKNSEVAQRTTQVRAATAELNRMKLAFPLNKAKARAALESAKANLPYSQASIDLTSLQKNQELAQARVNTSIVVAPTDGRVLRIRTRAGEAVRNQSILTLADLRAMWVVAEVYESDLLSIREGQRAKITSRVLPEAIAGKVMQVGRLINRQTVFDLDPAAATDARVGEVRILLDSAEPASRVVNLQVTATIEVGEKER